MTRSYRKNTLRTFKNTLSRFAAVFAIVALGVGFLAGLSGTPIDMRIRNTDSEINSSPKKVR